MIGSGCHRRRVRLRLPGLGVQVTLVSSRDRVMPHEDADAAVAIERVFRERGMTILNNSRADAVERDGDGVVVHARRRPHGRRLARADGRRLRPEHRRPGPGRIRRRARPRAATSRSTGSRGPTSPASTPPATAPACCRSPVVAAMQGRIAMWHALGEAVARCGCDRRGERVHRPGARHRRRQPAGDRRRQGARPAVMLPLAGNARAKMAGLAAAS